LLIIQEKALLLFVNLKRNAEEEGATSMKDLGFKVGQDWFE
jgi:hypothetical protein